MAESHLWSTQHSMPGVNQHMIIDLVPPCQKIFQGIKIATWILSLEEEPSRNLTWRTERQAWISLPSRKKGRLFGKSRTSDFLRHIPGNTLLTKALNYYLELNFCRQCIYQQQSWSYDSCRLNKLPIVSTLRNCFSESPWKGSGRLVEYQTPLTPPL